MTVTPSSAFRPLKIGSIELKQRIAMAPLTRFRADSTHTHHEVAAEYYAQRAATEGTLLITEATFISPKAGGLGNVPGVYSEDQISAWKNIVKGVHDKKSFLFMQLWNIGRVASAENLRNEGAGEVVSASDIPLEGGDKPRPLTVEEIQQHVKDYAQAAINFIEKAGGDGVELHFANGYLAQQFLETQTNNRTDQYGGSVENRARFALEVIDAVVKAVGAKKVGFRLSPWTTFLGMKMPRHEDTIETYSYLVRQIKERHPEVAYLHVVESRIAGYVTVDNPSPEEGLEFLYKIWSPSPLLVAGGFKADDIENITSATENTVIVFGRYFISNPDLVERVRKGVPFADYDRETFYVPGPENTKGYTDYPIAT